MTTFPSTIIVKYQANIVKQNKNPCKQELIYNLVISTGFGPVNAAVKGQCVKPLHQLAK